MNIGIFTDTFCPQINGVVTSIRTLEKELSKKGHKVYIFTVSHPEIKKDCPNIFRLPSMPFIFLKSYRVGVLYPLKVVRMVKQLKLDIIHTQTEFSLGLFGKLMAKRLNLPCIHTYHTMYEDYVHYASKGRLSIVTPRMAKQLSRIFCNHTHLVIAPTKKVEQILKSYGVKRPIVIIPTGIDLEPFKKKYCNREEIARVKRKNRYQSNRSCDSFYWSYRQGKKY
jgi:1,2-diacylglycerol 3-alpha-glucosyltransferase